jgi:hypothetical protein
MYKVRLAAAVLLGAVVPSSGATAETPRPDGPRQPQFGSAKQTARARDCFWQLRNGASRELSCEYKSWLTDEERSDLKRITREFLLDARCEVDVRIERRAVRDAMTVPDNVFTAPPQPVTCTIETAKGPLTITGKFAPRVVFKGGVVVEGSPVLTDVKGVNSYLAWPVIQYVNRSQRIRDGMLGMINAYLGRQAAKN